MQTVGQRAGQSRQHSSARLNRQVLVGGVEATDDTREVVDLGYVA